MTHERLLTWPHPSLFTESRRHLCPISAFPPSFSHPSLVDRYPGVEHCLRKGGYIPFFILTLPATIRQAHEGRKGREVIPSLVPQVRMHKGNIRDCTQRIGDQIVPNGFVPPACPNYRVEAKGGESRLFQQGGPGTRGLWGQARNILSNGSEELSRSYVRLLASVDSSCHFGLRRQ